MFKKIILGLAILMIISISWLTTTFSANVLQVDTPPTILLSENRSPSIMRMHAISAGKMYSKAGLAFRGGDLNEERVFTMGGVLVTHPKGNVLIDAGFASNIDEHFATTPYMMQKTSRYEGGDTVAAQLPKVGLSVTDLSSVILTHTHWDHVSGLADLPDVPVWVSKEELAFVNSESELSKLARMIGTKNYSALEFEKVEFMGFSQSADLFGDGSLVVVPAAGHTPGAVIVFVTLPTGQIYALIGDLAWQKEGIDLPAEKPWLPRTLVKEDTEAVRKLLIHMHQLQELFPTLTVVPSHDEKVWKTLPQI